MNALETHLMTLEANEFLDTASLYLGPVSMPYNKHTLISSLVSFFSQPLVKENLISSITDEESRILSLVSCFQPVRQERLEALYTGAHAKSFTRCVRNLLKRTLLLFDEDHCLNLNSSLDFSAVLNAEVFSQSRKSEKRNVRLKETLKAFASVVNTEHMGASTHSQKRTVRAHQDAFVLLSPEETETLFSSFISACLSCGAMYIEAESVLIDKDRMVSFFSMSVNEIKAALLAGGKADEQAMHLAALASELRAEEAVRFYRAVYECADEDREIYERLLKLDFIMSDDEECSQSDIIVQNDMSIRSTSTSPDSMIFLFTTVALVDRMLTYTISKESVKAAFDCQLSLEDILSALGECSDTIRTQLEEWREQYDRICLYDCICLVTDERNARLIENLPLLQIHIIRKVSQNAFLFKKSTQAQWRRILVYSGFDMLGKTECEKEEENVEENNEEMHSAVTSAFLLSQLPEHRQESSSLWKEKLERAVNEKAGEENRQAYLDLLSSGCLLSPSQIVPGRTFPVARSASGFDYSQKLALIRQAVKDSCSLYEITCASGNVTGTAEELKKGSDDYILTLLTQDGKSIEFPVGRIFRIRQILS